LAWPTPEHRPAPTAYCSARTGRTLPYRRTQPAGCTLIGYLTAFDLDGRPWGFLRTKELPLGIPFTPHPHPFGYGVPPDERSRIEPEIVERPHTDEERVLLLLDVMLAVYRDLPDLRTETVRVLTDGFQGRVAVPEQIVTALDEGDEEAVIPWQPETAAGVQNRQRVIGALTALRQAVVSE
jgi:hypothetical protein